MKLNNKGITLVEIIICVTLIAIVLVFLMAVLITVRNEDERSKTISNLLINQAIIIKEIEKDFIEYELIGITSCDDNAKANGFDSVVDYLPQSSSLHGAPEGNCLKLNFNPAKTSFATGYLLYYTYRYAIIKKPDGTFIDDNIHIVGYVRGDRRVFRQVPKASSSNGTVNLSCANNYCALRIDLPVLTEDKDNYGINLSYTYHESTPFTDNSFNDSTYDFNMYKH